MQGVGVPGYCHLHDARARGERCRPSGPHSGKLQYKEEQANVVILLCEGGLATLSTMTAADVLLSL